MKDIQYIEGYSDRSNLGGMRIWPCDIDSLGIVVAHEVTYLIQECAFSNTVLNVHVANASEWVTITAIHSVRQAIERACSRRIVSKQKA